jgi:hypothetical protein
MLSSGDLHDVAGMYGKRAVVGVRLNSWGFRIRVDSPLLWIHSWLAVPRDRWKLESS